MGREPHDSGYVTLAVLVMAGLMAALVSGLVTVSRPAVGLARTGVEAVAAEALLDGGIAAAGYLLFAAKREPLAVDGLDFTFRSGAVRVAVADESGRIDLNAAPPALLAGLYAAAGGTAMKPAAFAARILDWRDKDEDRGDGGAEAFDYARARLGYRPPNAPFRSAEDLRLVLGVSGADSERLLPLVTVFSAAATVDALGAPPAVLRAVPGVTPADLRRVLAARAGPGGEAVAAALSAAYPGFFGPPGARIYRVTVTARLRSGFTRAAEAVLTAAPAGDGADYRVLAWSPLAPATAR
jgi:type II secretory pathway component PulK